MIEKPKHYTKNFPVLQTERLNLIEITRKHTNDILTLFGNKDVAQYYNLVTFNSEHDSIRFIEYHNYRFLNNQAFRWGITLKDKNRIIGTIGFSNLNSDYTACIDYDLHPEYWKKGYMNEALNKVLYFGFNNLKITKVEAKVMQGNKNSERLLYKQHFKKEEIMKQWKYWNGKHHDMFKYALLKSDYVLN
jgi:ribosomal-protein-alanine N-acetyltransferase